MCWRSVLDVRKVLQRVKNKLFGSVVSPKEFEDQLEKKAVELEERVVYLEREAQLRKRVAAAKLRMREAEKEMGRGYGKVLKLVVAVVVVLVMLFAVFQSCEDAKSVGEVEQGTVSDEAK